MVEQVQFHFLMLAVGEVLKRETLVNAQKIQDEIVMNERFGVRVPLDQCRNALTLMEESGFIIKSGEYNYEKAK